MKNSIFVKLLAILLCAASLMGIVGSAAGMLVLSENDLYNKTVEEIAADRVRIDASEFANQIAYRYADQTLGGCPVEISRHGNQHWLSRNYVNYGYSILNAEGTVLEALNTELKDSTQTHAIPITGQYMHLVSLQSASQAMEEAAQKRLDSYDGIRSDALPAEGISLNHVIFTDQNGNILYEATSDGVTGSSTYYYTDYLLDNGTVDSFANGYQDHRMSRTGFLFYNADRKLTYTSILEEHEKAFEVTVYGVLFHNGPQDFTYQAENPEGIGTLSNESGYLLFTAFDAISEAAPVETVPETTVAELTEESTPAAESQETVPPETESPEAKPVEMESHETGPVSVTEAENAEDPPAAEAEESSTQDPEPPKTDEEHFEQLTGAVYARVFGDWLMENGLIAEDERPESTISDETLREWLIHYELLDKEQAFPAVTPEESSEEAPPIEETVSPEPQEEKPEPQPEVPEPVTINGKPLESYQINQTDYYNYATNEYTTAKYVYLPMPELTVEVYLGPELLNDTAQYAVLQVLRQFSDYLLPVLGVCLLLFVLTAVYLCAAAGHSPKAELIRAGGLNRLPLDLYLLLGISLGVGAAALAAGGVPYLISSNFLLGCSLAAAAAFVCCLIVTGFFFACIAQGKTGGGFWWRNTLAIRSIFLFMTCAEKLSHWLREKALPSLWRFLKKSWRLIRKGTLRLHERTAKSLSRIGKTLDRFFSLIPMTWQWLLGGLAIILFALLVNTGHILLILVGILVPIAIVLYATHCFGILSESAKRMGKGNLDSKAEDRFMMGCFRDFARDLNDLADVATEAAQKQLKSERMKTELITNVSHDIKTPLTSIINYVDLMQKPHTEEEEAQYLEVLDRQSQRLKKLVDDLMDMSKASTGNMAVEITQVDMVEAVNQALGEFAGKLDRAQLYPVFRHNDVSVPIMADGKLVWRILSNLLSNVVKYAMPRTRIYLDLSRVRGQVVLSLKNISREELNINAEELMERFVRGDISRNTEGSGLGLNIAKSLMELQKGQLQILVDGDLFKVTLIFPDIR